MRWRRASPLGLNYGFGLSPRRPHRKLIRLLRSVGYEREESPHFCLWLRLLKNSLNGPIGVDP